MIRITDMTFSCIEAFHPAAGQLKKLFELLNALGSDFIEMSPAVYDGIKPIPVEKLLLRVSNPAETVCYPEISRFICRKSGFAASPAITLEIQVNDVKEISFLGQSECTGTVRITGLDDILNHDYGSAFAKLQKKVKGKIEFCPENSRHCATAAAVEWIVNGGTDVAAAFGGIGGKASLEEVLLSLRVVMRHKPSATFAIFPQIAALIEEIVSTRFSDRKAVIGRKIFDVESGIHIDGILKKPQMYEPFFPELVGNKRLFIVGKHSGRKSIAAKLGELGCIAKDFDIAGILREVRDESITKMSSLTDEEFYKIAQKYRL